MLSPTFRGRWMGCIVFFNIFLKTQIEYVTLRSILKVYPRYFVENSLISED